MTHQCHSVNRPNWNIICLVLTPVAGFCQDYWFFFITGNIQKLINNVQTHLFITFDLLYIFGHVPLPCFFSHFILLCSGCSWLFFFPSCCRCLQLSLLWLFSHESPFCKSLVSQVFYLVLFVIELQSFCSMRFFQFMKVNSKMFVVMSPLIYFTNDLTTFYILSMI